MRPSTRIIRLLPLLALAFLPAGAAAQSAADIMADFRAQYEQRMEGIQNYTVVQRVMGTGTTVYYERHEVDGVPVYRPQMDMGNEEVPNPRGEMGEGFFLRQDVADRMTHEGSDVVDGHACEIVKLDDFTGLEDLGDGEVSLETMTFCLDTEAYVPRRMTMEGTTSMGDQSRPISTSAVFKDYRETDGFLHPWRVEMSIGGMGMDSEQQARMEQMKEQMEEQLEQLPEAQRERMRTMMEERMQGMEGMMGVASGEPMVVETVEVKVNAGPPEGGDR